MGNLVKWRGRELPVDDLVAQWRARQRKELADHVETRELARAATSGMIAAPGEVIWLPRVCAVTAEGWIAAYIGEADGRFSFSETIRMPESRWRQFRNGAAAGLVNVGDRSREECAWCGASYRGWPGPVTCSECRSKVCFGRTTADEYFRCHPGCPGEGQLKPMKTEEIGFAPSLYRGGQVGR